MELNVSFVCSSGPVFISLYTLNLDGLQFGLFKACSNLFSALFSIKTKLHPKFILYGNL